MAPKAMKAVMKVAMKAMVVGMAMKAMKLQPPNEPNMSLTEKLEKWKESQDIKEPLELKTEDQKRLASRFQTALQKATPAAHEAWKEACASPPGLRNESYIL